MTRQRQPWPSKRSGAASLSRLMRWTHERTPAFLEGLSGLGEAGPSKIGREIVA
jgi:hypothetical protein